MHRLAMPAFALLLAAGCGSTTTVATKAAAPAAAADPWPAAASRLRKDTDVGNVRSVIAQLNSDLSLRPEIAPQIPESAVEELAATLPLAPADRELVRGGTFTTLDAGYIADAFYARDAVRGLDAAGLPPPRQAELAFAWVCRQVLLSPWVTVAGRQVRVNPPVPPVYVLRRGSGSGLERAYVFLALAQQLGLDACLIGPPEADQRGWRFDPAGNTPLPYKGPFWAVGVRVGADVLAFDPWRGEPFPGPGGKGVATLAQLRANPDLVKSWLDEKDRPWNVTAADLKVGTVFLAPPLSAVSPRMRVLDEKLKADTGLNLAIDPAAVRKRFEAAAPGGPGEKPKFWNPPADGFAYPVVLATFLPAEEGGRDATPPGAARLVDRYRVEQLPQDVLFYRPAELRDDAAFARLRSASAEGFAAAFLAPPTPRERIQRGQYNEAARVLVENQDRFVRGLEGLRRDRDAKAVKEWCDAVDALYANLGAARLTNDDGAVKAAQAAIEQFWKTRAATAQLVIDRMSAEAGMTEATYLLAVCKHEVAERQQARLERASDADRGRAAADARDAWRVANTTWQAVLTRPGPPARLEQAKRLGGRAAKMAAG